MKLFITDRLNRKYIFIIVLIVLEAADNNA